MYSCVCNGSHVSAYRRHPLALHLEKPKYEGAWSSRSLAPLISIVTVSLIPWYYHPKKRIQNAWLRAMIANVYDADRSAGASLSLSLTLFLTVHRKRSKQ